MRKRKQIKGGISLEKMFLVHIRGEGPYSYETETELELPASRNTFLDALQRARIEDGHHCSSTVVCCWAEGLPLHCLGRDTDLYELNLLAMRLSEMTWEEHRRLYGLVVMEQATPAGAVPIPQLINLTMNLDHCARKPEIRNDAALGRFFYENQAAPSAFTRMMDAGEDPELVCALIGRYRREHHHGTFTKYGYTECETLESRYLPGLLPYFPEPEGALVLEYETGAVVLPAEGERFRALADAPFLVTDCAVPEAGRWIQSEQDPEAILQFAEQIQRAEQDGTLTRYKALLEAVSCSSLQEANRLYERMEEFEFRAEIAHTWNYAEAELRGKYPDLPPLLFQSSQAYQVGLDMMEQDHAVLTAYGMVRRLDRQPVLAAAEPGYGPEILQNAV